jgi:ketosteroid isomerase-like protein
VSESIARWLREWERLINADDQAAARAMFAPDVVGYGTLAEATAGIDELAQRQWALVWHRIRSFTFGPPDLVRVDGSLAVVALRWRSVGLGQDGKPFARSGRATLLLERAGEVWLCRHSHLSMLPGTSALR